MKRLIFISLALATLVACQQSLVDERVSFETSTQQAKIVNSSRNAVEGAMILKFTDDVVAKFEATRGDEVTRADVPALNAVLTRIAAVNVERLFVVDVNHEERARAAGLHRWYVVEFDEQMNLDMAANLFAGVEGVERVQFNSRLENPRPEVTPCQTSPDASFRDTYAVNDPQYSRQWHYDNRGDKQLSSAAVAGNDINLTAAWKYEMGDSSIVVAVVDEGVNYTHPDLAANMWVNEDEIPGNGIDDDGNGYVDDVHGLNFVTGGPITWALGSGPTRDSGHGTHIAGTISAVNNNMIGVAGIAGGKEIGTGVRIMSTQIFSASVSTLEATARAYQYAANNGAHIAQSSWGYTTMIADDDAYKAMYGAELEALLYFQSTPNNILTDGSLHIFAAGNDGWKQAGYPGAYRDFIAVSSFGINGMPAYYTCYDLGVNIAAPGGDMRVDKRAGGVLSTLPAEIVEDREYPYGYMQGTSMACPHVSGVAALGLSYAKRLGKTFTLKEFQAMLLTSVNSIDATLEGTNYSGYINKMGSGKIDALQMLMNIEGIPCIVVPRGESNYRLDISPYIGDGKSEFRPISMKFADGDLERLGTTEPRIFAERFLMTCNNTGSAVVEVTVLPKGAMAGTESQIGSLLITKKFVLIVRDNVTDNGGWL